MKKTLTYLLVVVALVALASSAYAVTCTIDQRPAATLLVPYFQVNLNADGTPDLSATGTDTLITVVNASSAPTLAHVTVWNRRSVHVLDFNIALTGFDVVSWSMRDILGSGLLPNTPDNGSWEGKDVCERNASAKEYPDANGWLRFRPDSLPLGTIDQQQATTQYGAGDVLGPDFRAELADELDYDSNQDCDTDSTDGDITGSAVVGNGNLSGYVTIDMANYCTVTFPDDPSYYDLDAIGYENNLFGDYLIVSNSGIPTLGASTVQVEAALDNVIIFDGVFFPPQFDGFLYGSIFGSIQPFNEGDGYTRTFYARYWSDPLTGNFGDSGGISNGDEGAYMSAVFPFVTATYGDQREPLGVRYGVRYLNDGTFDSHLRVWRASAHNLIDLTGASCTAKEVNILVTAYDSDETTTQTGGCPSPCPQTSHNFPYETQRTGVDVIGALPTNGWAYLNFIGGEAAAAAQSFDQAWVDYEMSFPGHADVNASVPGTQLDPSTCFPEGFTDLDPSSSFAFGLYPWPVGLGK